MRQFSAKWSELYIHVVEISLPQRLIVNVCIFLYGTSQTPPLKSEDPLHPWSNTVSHQDLQSPLPVQGVIGLSEVNISSYSPSSHCCQILEKIGFKGCGTHPPYHQEPTEGIVKSDSHRETLVEESCYCLPQELHEAYPPEVLAALWNKYHRLPDKLLCQSPAMKIIGPGRQPYTSFSYLECSPLLLPGSTCGGSPP